MGSLFSRQTQLSMDSRMPLGDGTSMPVIGFGTYQVKNEDVGACVTLALDNKYPHIDTAEGYDNEAGVGAALAGNSPIYITTKLWPGNPDWGQTPKTYETTVAACKASKEKLGATPDLYLIHGPFSGGPETAKQFPFTSGEVDAEEETKPSSTNFIPGSYTHLTLPTTP